MWTKDTGKTPFLSGCPSMCPICGEKGEASGGRRPVGPSALGADAEAGGMQALGRHDVGATHGGTAFTGVALPAGSPGRRMVLGPSLSTRRDRGPKWRSGLPWSHRGCGLNHALNQTARPPLLLGDLSKSAKPPVCKTGLKNPCFSGLWRSYTNDSIQKKGC